MWNKTENALKYTELCCETIAGNIFEDGGSFLSCTSSQSWEYELIYVFMNAKTQLKMVSVQKNFHAFWSCNEHVWWIIGHIGYFLLFHERTKQLK